MLFDLFSFIGLGLALFKEKSEEMYAQQAWDDWKKADDERKAEDRKLEWKEAVIARQFLHNRHEKKLEFQRAMFNMYVRQKYCLSSAYFNELKEKRLSFDVKTSKVEDIDSKWKVSIKDMDESKRFNKCKEDFKTICGYIDCPYEWDIWDDYSKLMYPDDKKKTRSSLQRDMFRLYVNEKKEIDDIEKIADDMRYNGRKIENIKDLKDDEFIDTTENNDYDRYLKCCEDFKALEYKWDYTDLNSNMFYMYDIDYSVSKYNRTLQDQFNSLYVIFGRQYIDLSGDLSERLICGKEHNTRDILGDKSKRYEIAVKDFESLGFKWHY